tara:strand:- start:750 stop:1097 length:348 start_codon:yes stop_codon:yes gene_type:complete
MRHYESVFILNPALSEDQVKDSIKKYEKFLNDNGCNIIDIENWGLKKLAYSIQKKLSGFYALIDFEYDSDTNVIDLYETELKRDERIMRYLNVSLDKDANNWAVKRRKRLKKDKV